MSSFRNFLITPCRVWGQQTDCAHPSNIECDTSTLLYQIKQITQKCPILLTLLSIKSRLNYTAQQFYYRSWSSWGGDNPCDGNWIRVFCVDVSKNASQLFRVTKLAFGDKDWFKLDDGSLNFTRSYDKPIVQFNQVLPIELTKIHSYPMSMRMRMRNAYNTSIRSVANIAMRQKCFKMRLSEIQRGNIPWEIYELKNLQALDSQQNKLTGSIPENLSSLPILKLLSASENNLTGNIPSEFSWLKKLECFAVADIQLNGSHQIGFSELHPLKKLSLLDNLITQIRPPQYSRFSNLEKFSIENNNLIGSLPEEFSQLNHYRSILEVLEILGYNGSIMSMQNLEHETLGNYVWTRCTEQNIAKEDGDIAKDIEERTGEEGNGETTDDTEQETDFPQHAQNFKWCKRQ